jgi:transcription initiation factor TFIIE subunit beta
LSLISYGGLNKNLSPFPALKVLYYNDKYCRYSVDEEFQKLWRGVSVEGMDERKIEDYLEKQGITSMQDVGIKKVVHSQKRKKAKKNNKFKKLNEHLDELYFPIALSIHIEVYTAIQNDPWQ